MWLNNAMCKSCTENNSTTQHGQHAEKIGESGDYICNTYAYRILKQAREQ